MYKHTHHCMSQIKDLESEKYISVGTYKKDMQIVQTPVWFYTKDEQIYIVTRSKTGKAKRLQNNSNVLVAKCTINGKITGPQISGVATIIKDDGQIKEAVKLRDKKYGMMARFAKFLSRGKGEFFVFSIRFTDK